MVTIIENQAMEAIRRIPYELNRIANVLEAQEKRAREIQVDPNSLGAKALWMQEVAAGDCLIGFADWVAWHATTPEDIEALAPAIQAVRRGFDSMEQAVREQREGEDG